MADVTKSDPPKRPRRGSRNATRELLLDAAEKLIVEEGYAAVTSRRLSAKASLKSQLVHYYFQTIDDIFVAVIKRRATRNLQNMVRTITHEDPLEGVWRGARENEAAIFWQELLALANHRKPIREEVRHYTEQRRLLHAAALERTFSLSGMEPNASPIAWSLLIGGVMNILASETVLGLSSGHTEVIQLLKDILRGAGMLPGSSEDELSEQARQKTEP